MNYSAPTRYYLGLMLALSMLASCLPASSYAAFSSRPAPRLAPPPNSTVATRTGVNSSAAATFTERQVREAYSQLPLSFEPNRGQFDRSVKFIARGGGHTTFLTATETVFVMRGRRSASGQNSSATVGNSPTSIGELQQQIAERQQHKQERRLQELAARAVVRMRLVGGNENSSVIGSDELPGKINHFWTNNPKKWATDVPVYAQVKYAGVYPGIDVVYHSVQGQLEYDFVVAPGADPRAIALDFAGADNVEVDAGGDLVIHAKDKLLRQHRPLVYQEINGQRVEVQSGFVMQGTAVGFQLGHYDATRRLVIDPVLSYSTFLGDETDDDNGFDIAVDADGNAYVAGQTFGEVFPTEDPFQSINNDGHAEAFVTKFNPAGSALIFSSYLGGTQDEAAYGIALDGDRNVYLTGYTDSSDFPRQHAMQQSCGSTESAGFGGNTTQCREDEAFVAKVAAAGNHLIFSTYLGGSGPERGRGVAVDSANNVYVTGFTESYNFPTTHPLQPFINGFGSLPDSANSCCKSDAFLTKIEPGGQFRLYSTFIGGAQNDVAMDVAVDADGNAYVTGFTDSTTFDPTGTTTPTPTPTPAPGPTPSSALFPTTAGAFQTQPSATGSTREAFVTKVNPTGAAYHFSTLIGGNEEDAAYGIAVGADRSVYITGSSDSRFTRPADPDAPPDPTNVSYPTTDNAFQPQNNGGYDAFITRFKPDGSGLIYSSLLGGERDEGKGTLGFNSEDFDGPAIAVDFAGNASITGWTESTAVSTPTPAPACASSFSFPDFSPTPIPNLSLNGSTTQSGTALRLTPDATNQSGSAFYNTPVNAAADFTTTFGFKITVTTGQGGNGFAFNLTNDGANTLPANGADGTREDFSVSLNTFNGVDSSNTLNIFFLDNNVATVDVTGLNLDDGNAHTVTVTYTGGTVSVTIDGAASPVLSAPINLSLISSPTYAGFSARTSNEQEAHDILSWSFSGAATCPAPAPGPTPLNFPVKDAVQPQPGSDPGATGPNARDAFVAKFNTNAAGEASLIYSTFLGGYQDDEGQGIAVDFAGNAYVTGKTGGSQNCAASPAIGANNSLGVICGRAASKPLSGAAAQSQVSLIACAEDNDFPTTPGSFNSSKCDEVNSTVDQDAFVTKIGGGPFAGSTTSGSANDQTFSIAGQVTTSGGSGVGGVTITVTRADNTIANTATTGSDGIYSLDGLAPDTYTVTPTAPAGTTFSFAPPRRTVIVTNQNERADFTATRLFSISGTVREGSAGRGGVTVTVTRDNNAPAGTTTTGSDGTYTVTGLPAGTYTVTPTQQFYTFTPPSTTLTLSSDRAGADFAATRQQFSIAGHIATPSGTPVGGVTVTLSGAAAATVDTNANGDYSFGNLAAGGNYTVTPSKPNFALTPPSRTISGLSGNQTADFTATPGAVNFTAAAAPAGSESARSESAGSFQITVARTGDVSGATDVDYATFDGPAGTATPQPSPGPPAASERTDYITSLGRLHFAAGETTKAISVFIIDDAFVEGNEMLSLVLSNPTNGVALGATTAVTLTIIDNDLAATNINPIDSTAFFVRQQYLDFLNREPDAAGLAFWSNEINQCAAAANRGPGETEAQCVLRKRVQVSKAFYLSIEFQETGFFVIRAYRAALDRFPEFREFLRDTQQVQRGGVVGQAGFETQLENNKATYLREFVRRPEFLARYPEAETRDQYVDALFAAARFTPTAAERQQVINAYDSGGADRTEARARALRALAELGRFRAREFNPAFVIMEYIGYLRRDPDDPGFNFWLGVLNANNDQNQMVNAFISSGEYRQRFGQ